MDNVKDDKIFISHILDKSMECMSKNIPCATGFMDLRGQSLALSAARDFAASFELWGGYGYAERKILIFLPDYEFDRSQFLRVIRAVYRSSKPLGHRDFLGALMSLGIKREFVGDILVSENGADIIIKPEMETFLLSNLSKAAKVGLSVSSHPISELIVPLPPKKEITFSVSSLRLDSVLSAAFNLSRSKACEAVKSQIVFVNGILCLKPDKSIDLGDKITLRGRGRVIISGIGSKSRKGKTFVSAEVFK